MIGIAGINFVLTISLHRLYCCLHPIRALLFTKHHTRIVAALIWTVSSTLTVISSTISSGHYSKPAFGCVSKIYNDYTVIVAVFVLLQIILPLFVIITVNIILCYIVLRVKHTLRSKGVVMVCSISGLFFCSWAPFIIYNLANVVFSYHEDGITMVASFALFLKVCWNPIVYSCTNRGFGRFVKQLITCSLKSDRKRSRCIAIENDSNRLSLQPVPLENVMSNRLSLQPVPVNSLTSGLGDQARVRRVTSYLWYRDEGKVKLADWF